MKPLLYRSVFLRNFSPKQNCIYVYLTYRKKVKWSRYRPGVTQRVGRDIALLFHDRGTRRWVSGQQHAPAALIWRIVGRGMYTVRITFCAIRYPQFHYWQNYSRLISRNSCYHKSIHIILYSHFLPKVREVK